MLHGDVQTLLLPLLVHPFARRMDFLGRKALLPVLPLKPSTDLEALVAVVLLQEAQVEAGENERQRGRARVLYESHHLPHQRPRQRRSLLHAQKHPRWTTMASNQWLPKRQLEEVHGVVRVFVVGVVVDFNRA